MVHRLPDLTQAARGRLVPRVALAALAMVLAVALTGCGRKGGLDPPPLAANDQPQAGQTGQPGQAPAAAPAQPANQSNVPSAPKRPTVLDWLIN